MIASEVFAHELEDDDTDGKFIIESISATDAVHRNERIEPEVNNNSVQGYDFPNKWFYVLGQVVPSVGFILLAYLLFGYFS